MKMNKIIVVRYMIACMTLGAASSYCSEGMYLSEEARKPSPGNTTYHIDPVKGNDSADGLTEKTAWKDFTPVNQRVFHNGDVIRILAPGSFSQSLMPISQCSVKNIAIQTRDCTDIINEKNIYLPFSEWADKLDAYQR